MKENKLNLLLITSRFPWPLNNGMSNKNFSIIKGLSKKHNLHLAVITRQNVSSEDLKVVNSFCKSIKLFKPSVIDISFGILNSFIRIWPFQLALFWSNDAYSYFKNFFNKYDLVIFSVLRVCQYQSCFKKPKIFELADLLSLSFSRSSAYGNIIKRITFFIESKRLKRYERYLTSLNKPILLFNRSEVDYLKKSNVFQVSHGVNENLLKDLIIDNSFSDGFVIFGKLSFEPNNYACLWFIKNIFPYLNNSPKLYLIGSSPSKKLVSLANKNKNIIICGFLDDPYPLIKGSLGNLCPVITGSGIQNKVLEGMAVGALNIVSQFAAKPFKEPEKGGLIVCNNVSDWINILNKIVKEPNLYQNNRRKGIEYSRCNLSWQNYNKNLLRLINEEIDGTKRANY